MALQQRTVLGKITINHSTGGHCETQYINEIYDDVTDEIISSNFHRLVVSPDDDVGALAAGVNNISGGAWIPEIRDAEQKRADVEVKIGAENAANAAVADDIANGRDPTANEAIANAAAIQRANAEATHKTAVATLKTAITVTIP